MKSPSPSSRSTATRAWRDYLRTLLGTDERLVVVSNRGPLTFTHDRAGEWQRERGSGGLVTALAEVGRLAPVTWISAAMDAGRPRRGASCWRRRRAGETRGAAGSASSEQLPGQDLRLVMRDVPGRRVASALRQRRQPVPVVHAAPAVHAAVRADRRRGADRRLAERLPRGQRGLRRDDRRADARRLAAGGAAPGLPPVSRGALRSASSGRTPAAALQPHPVAVGRLVAGAAARRCAARSARACWPTTSAACRQTATRRNFLDTVEAFVRDARVDPAGRHVRWRGRTIWVRAYPISIDPDSLADVRARTGGRQAARGAVRPTRAGRQAAS